MDDISIRKATADDDDAVLAIFNGIHPDRPPIDVEEYRSMQRRQPERTAGERYVAELGGMVVGSLELWESSGYREPHTVRVFLEVAAPYRRRGIGEGLYRLLEERMPAIQMARAYSAVREDDPDALAFAERRGFARTGKVDRGSRLDVARARLDGLAEIEGRIGSEGVRIATVEELGAHSALLHSIHQVESEIERDIPSTDPRVDRDYDEWHAGVFDAPGRSPATMWLALDGDVPVGVARFHLRGERMAVHGLTGVARAYRGRGIASALKLRAVLGAGDAGIRYLYTWNDMRNLPIIAINDRIGYEVLPGEIELMKEYAP